MRSIRMVATGVGLAAVLVAGATGAEEKALGTRLVDQTNTLRGASRHSCQPCHGCRVRGHVDARAGHGRAQLRRLPQRPAHATDNSLLQCRRCTRRARYASFRRRHPRMAIKFRLADGGENDIVCISANGFPVATGEDFLALLRAVGASGPTPPSPPRSTCSWRSSGRRGISRDTEASGGELWHPALLRRQRLEIHQREGVSKFGRYRIEPVSGPAYVSDDEAAKRRPQRLPTISGHRSRKDR